MNAITTITADEKTRLESLTLRDLLTEAEKYGNIYVHSSDNDRPPKCYSVSITFDTSPGTKVSAKSEFDMTIEDAFVLAILRARGIVDTMKGL